VRANKIKQMWRDGRCVTLGWLSVSHGFTAEVMARQGFDALCVDMQRGTTDMSPLLLIAVGGASFPVPERLAGISEVRRAPCHAVANAVGAAIAQLSGEVDQIFQNLTRGEALARPQRLAEENAIGAGADLATLTVVEMEDLPIAYLPGNSPRTRVRVVGDIARRGGKAGVS